MSKSLKKRVSSKASAYEHLESRRLLSYSVIDLGTLGGTRSSAVAVNTSRWVVGSSDMPGSTLSHAVLWQNGVMSDLGTLGGTTSAAADINDSGAVAGGSAPVGETPPHAFLWNSGVMTDLGTLGGSLSNARALNNHNQVVGTSQTAGGLIHGFVWENGVMYDLNALLPANSGWDLNSGSMYGINDNGQIVGQGVINGHQHAFRLTDNDGIFANGGAAIADLGTLGGPSSWAEDINNAGQVVGGANLKDGSYHAFRHSAGVMSDLKTLGGYVSNASGINDAGQVVGGSNFRNGGQAYHAFLWQNGKIADLNDQLPRGSTWTLEIAYDINRDGIIVGTFLNGGQRRAFMMVPGGVSIAPAVAGASGSATFSAMPIAAGASDVLAVDSVTVLG